MGAIIVNGTEVVEHSLPWQVSLVEPGDREPYCGGTLITDQHVLSAAHCMYAFCTIDDCYIPRPDFDVIVGEHKISDHSHGTRHHICRYTKHSEFNVGATFNKDFAMVHLKQRVVLGTRVLPACLPDSSLGGDFLAGKYMTLSGWGHLGEDADQPDVLHGATLLGITKGRCSQLYHEKVGIIITDHMMCTGDLEGIGACWGDSGGK